MYTVSYVNNAVYLCTAPQINSTVCEYCTTRNSTVYANKFKQINCVVIASKQYNNCLFSFTNKQNSILIYCFTNIHYSKCFCLSPHKQYSICTYSFPNRQYSVCIFTFPQIHAYAYILWTSALWKSQSMTYKCVKTGRTLLKDKKTVLHINSIIWVHSVPYINFTVDVCTLFHT